MSRTPKWRPPDLPAWLKTLSPGPRLGLFFDFTSTWPSALRVPLTRKIVTPVVASGDYSVRRLSTQLIPTQDGTTQGLRLYNELFNR